MSCQQFRFLHAADFQLDRPCDGLTEIPEHLLDTLVDAPYRAAQKVLETALAEQVSLVLLTGDLIGHEQPTARAYALLRDQFRQYHEHGIEVCWAGNRVINGAVWPESVQLPPNVHLLPIDQVESVPIRCGTRTVAEVVGMSVAREFKSSDLKRFVAGKQTPLSMALVPGRAEPPEVSSLPFDYWALAGSDRRESLHESSPILHDPGPTQGRRPSQAGPHGCTIGELDSEGVIELRFVPCDQVRWHTEHIAVSAAQPLDAWKSTLAQRTEELRQLAPDVPLLITWCLEVVGNHSAAKPLADSLATLVDWLRNEYGHQSPPCWTVALDIERPAVELDEWQHEDTLLGDYLRAVEQVSEAQQPLAELIWPADEELRQILGTWLDVTRPDVRRRVLRSAAELGALMLRGEHVLQ